ncbi:MAG: hypothetical protein AMJ68_06025 [Acidithiobacillales bacterium SG8_45]|jgi:uncharacterized protein|nr:MAG: hypothetical protein AMJ68_06025 [Acidithiobacillales bacterium SG8_45]
MSGGLPTSIDPIWLADQETHLSGTIPLKRMTRLVAGCRSDAGEASVDLQFRSEPNGERRSVRGRIEASVETTCERCLESMTLPLVAEIDMVIVTPEQVSVMDEHEDLLVAEGPMVLSELAENELILAMPMIPMHPLDKCPASELLKEQGIEKEKGQDGAKAESPFAKLAELKRSDR